MLRFFGTVAVLDNCDGSKSKSKVNSCFEFADAVAASAFKSGELFDKFAETPKDGCPRLLKTNLLPLLCAFLLQYFDKLVLIAALCLVWVVSRDRPTFLLIIFETTLLKSFYGRDPLT